MSEYRTIEIDFDIHKKLEAERRSFSEPDYVVLRRLLSMKTTTAITPVEPRRPNPGLGREWFGDGVRLPHGTELRMTYNNRLHLGQIEDGQWVVEGVRYTSPSAAAGGVARTKKDKKTNLDGWKYWEVKLPGDTAWKFIARMRWV